MNGTRLGMATAVATLAVLFAGLLTLGGCGTARSESFVLDASPTTGLLAVDIENFRGTVEVRAEARAESISVEHWVETTHAFDEELRAEAGEAVAVTADLEEEGTRAVLRVRSATLRQEADDHRVRLRVVAPTIDGVRIVNSGGDVVVVNTAGGVFVTNREGAIEVRTSRPIIDPVTLTTVNGNVYYQVPPESAAVFDLETLSGRVSYKDNDGLTDYSKAGGGRMAARLNSGQSPVVVRTNEGNIIVRVDENAVEFTRMFRRTMPDIRDSMFTNSTRRFTRNLPDDHPEVQQPGRRAGRSWDEWK